MPGNFRKFGLVWWAALVVLLVAAPARGQQSGVELDVQRDFLGLGGLVQRGVWTPVRLDLTNTSAENIEVTCRWLLSDDDGDELISERPNITLGAQQMQSVWLYANPPMSTRPDESWVFQAVATKSGELLKQVQLNLSSSAVVESSVNLVGVCGFKGLGLTPWTRWSTQHEQLKLVQGLNLETLPDRWYGLDSLSALVWYPGEGGEPTSSRMSDRSKRALREWVHRGGHLVLVLPYAGLQWTGIDSGLADLIEPIKPGAIRQAQASPPISVFGLLNNLDPVPLLWFDLADAPGYTSLAEVDLSKGAAEASSSAADRDPKLRPLIVGHRVGFGQVTLVGLDLSETSVLKSIDSFRLHRIWTRIFNWRGSVSGELLPRNTFEDQATAGDYIQAKDMQHVEMGSWIASRVARQRKTGPAVGLAFVLFVIYAIAAALTFPNLLRSKGWQRHSWVLFVGIVALFSVIAWGGAWAMRPASRSAAHFTVLDIDGNTNLVHARSWQSVLVPNFAAVEVAIPSENEGLAKMDIVNLLASPGLSLADPSPGYPDQRTYAFNASEPNAFSVPMRSTTKSFVVDYLGQITAQRQGMSRPWILPNAALRIAGNGLPAGTITHQFPGALTDVRIIFCPGGGQHTTSDASIPSSRPLVHEYRIWKANTPLVLPAKRSDYMPLWHQPKPEPASRQWKAEGYLGAGIEDRRFGSGQTGDTSVVKDMTLLNFFDALPPPKYRIEKDQYGTTLGYGEHKTYSRSMVRDIDLTRLINGRRLIIIGHLRNGPSPVPMTIDGQGVESEGWTVVRWIYDL